MIFYHVKKSLKYANKKNYSTKSELKNEIIELLLGNFEELQFAKRIFKQDLRTRQISASFVENAAASDEGLWERALGVKDSGKGRSFLLRFSHDPLRGTKLTPIDLDYVSRR